MNSRNKRVGPIHISIQCNSRLKTNQRPDKHLLFHSRTKKSSGFTLIDSISEFMEMPTGDVTLFYIKSVHNPKILEVYSSVSFNLKGYEP